MKTSTQFFRFVILAASALLFSRAQLNSADKDAASVAMATPYTREQFVSSLTHAITAHFNVEGDLQIELLRAWAPPTRSAVTWILNVSDLPASAASSMMARCRLAADGAVVLDTTFVVKAQLWRDAWVARTPLAVGALFDAAALETRRVDLLRERDVLPATVGDRNYVFARAITAGRLLTWRDVARRPLVKKGDLVEVSANDGPLLITMKALAMENGAQGDTVTVRNPESRKNFSALVIDENRVRVRF